MNRRICSLSFSIYPLKKFQLPSMTEIHNCEIYQKQGKIEKIEKTFKNPKLPISEFNLTLYV